MKKSTKKVTKQLSEPLFIGIDLAWSQRNPTGCAIIRNNRLIAHTGNLGSDDEIISFIRQHLYKESPAIIGIDAPLKVPNSSGARLCDRALSADWRQFQAGALPANRSIFARMNRSTASAPSGFEQLINLNCRNGDCRNTGLHNTDDQNAGEEQSALHNQSKSHVRGEALAALLSEHLRFSQEATIPRQTKGRMLCEIYPHPAHVSLFNLDKTLKYKARAGRSYEQRWQEMERYQVYLRNLRWADLPLKRTKKLLTQTDVRQMRGKAFKRYEDTLDAITCAYVVNYLWVYGPEFARTYGTAKDGHIIVPLTSKMKKRLAR
ncbi:MAG: DUF429 domain-containing protein [Chloroflexota bacterium]